MSRLIPFRFIQPPLVLPERTRVPARPLAKVTLPQLCRLAEIPLRVHGASTAPITCLSGQAHFLSKNRYYVGVGQWKGSRVDAIRVLEVLAHGFHDYAARECICNKGLFTTPRPIGRPLIGGRAMTARERMAAMRERRRNRKTDLRRNEG